jgi:DNA-binding response OmpR family regulator
MSLLISKQGSVRSATVSKQPKVLVVDDDEPMRKMLEVRLSDAYQVVGTGDPEEAVALALEHKPDAILMDLMMPGFSGFELCQSLHSLSYTSRIPIFVITGESGVKYRDYCSNLGAKGYFQKPIDFPALKAALTAELGTQRPERRRHKRVQMHVLVKLRGTNADGKPFEQATTTENVSVGGFLAMCSQSLVKGSVVEVFLTAGDQERYAGRAQTVRQESYNEPWHRYGFEFLETTSDWVLQHK